jgi:hypothetical protein
MYFINKDRTLCHILEDEESGKAPAPCGSKAGKIELFSFNTGKPTRLIVPRRPADIPLCKHCQKAEVQM